MTNLKLVVVALVVVALACSVELVHSADNETLPDSKILFEQVHAQLDATLKQELDLLKKRWNQDKAFASRAQEELERTKQSLANLQKEHDTKQKEFDELYWKVRAEHEEELAELGATSQSEIEQLKKLLETHMDQQGHEVWKLVDSLEGQIQEKEEQLNELKARIETDDQEVKDQHEEAEVLLEAMTDTDKSRRCLKYFVLFEQKGQLTKNRVRAIGELNLSKLTRLSYDIRPNFKLWLYNLVENVFSGTDSTTVRIREEILECVRMDSQYSIESTHDSEILRLRIKELEEDLLKERQKSTTREQIVESLVEQAELLHENMDQDRVPEFRCFKYSILFGQNAPTSREIVEIARLNFKFKDNQEYKDKLERVTKELAKRETSNEAAIGSEIRTCMDRFILTDASSDKN